MKDKAVIYGLIDPRTSQVRYVGKTSQPLPMRLRQHIFKARTNRENHSRAQWIRELLRVGVKPEIVALETVPESRWREAEREWAERMRAIGIILVNEATPGGGSSESHILEWTPELDARLGKEADSIIAEELGCSRKSVTYRREKLEIPASFDLSRMKPPPNMGGWNRIVLPDDIVAKLGTMPDYKLAELVGVSKKRIMRARHERGIPSWADANGNPTRYHDGHFPERWRKCQ